MTRGRRLLVLSAALAVVLGGWILAQGRTDPLVESCVADVRYWAQDHPDSGFDYQEMGLTGTTYDALRAVVRWQRAHPDASPAAVGEQARAECAAAYRDTPRDRSTGGWP